MTTNPDAGEHVWASSQVRAPTDVPALHGYAVLRKERFGGYVFNIYGPGELRLDHPRFLVAKLCDGLHDVEEIKRELNASLSHSKAYTDLLVDETLEALYRGFHLYWLDAGAEPPASRGDQSRIGRDLIPEHLSAPLFVIWEVTGGCNLKCRHCLSDSGRVGRGELSTDECKRLIDKLEAMKVFHISFSGGEPLVRKDLFELLEYASTKRIGIELLTNGTLVTEKTIEHLQRTNIFLVQVSVDGIGPTHDDFRGIKGAYDRAVNAIRLLRNAGYEVVVSTAVTRRNVDQVPEIIDRAIELGVNAYKTTLFMPAGRAGMSDVEDLLMTPADTSRFALMLSEKKASVGDRIHISNEVLYPWLTGIAEAKADFLPEGATPIGCTAGNSSLYIMPDGKIAPCPFLRQYLAGDLRVQPLEEIWCSSDVFGTLRSLQRADLKGKCGECELLGATCYGGCRAAALAYNGDLFAEDPLCWKQ